MESRMISLLDLEEHEMVNAIFRMGVSDLTVLEEQVRRHEAEVIELEGSMDLVQLAMNVSDIAHMKCGIDRFFRARAKALRLVEATQQAKRSIIH